MTDPASKSGPKSEPVKSLLAEKLAEKGLSQTDLAFATRISPSQISEWVRGTRFPRPDAIAAIAAALEEKPETVYGWLITPATAEPVEASQ